MSLSGWPINDRVLVNLVDETAISGVLLRRRGPLLVLAHGHVHSPGQEPTRADGLVYIERAKVLFIQKLTPEV